MGPQGKAILPSKNALSGFFRPWKDADPSIPILQQAKTEFAKLNP